MLVLGQDGGAFSDPSTPVPVAQTLVRLLQLSEDRESVKRVPVAKQNFVSTKELPWMKGLKDSVAEDAWRSHYKWDAIFQDELNPLVFPNGKVANPNRHLEGFAEQTAKGPKVMKKAWTLNDFAEIEHRVVNTFVKTANEAEGSEMPALEKTGKDSKMRFSLPRRAGTPLQAEFASLKATCDEFNLKYKELPVDKLSGLFNGMMKKISFVEDLMSVLVNELSRSEMRSKLDFREARWQSEIEFRSDVYNQILEIGRQMKLMANHEFNIALGWTPHKKLFREHTVASHEMLTMKAAPDDKVSYQEQFKAHGIVKADKPTKKRPGATAQTPPTKRQALVSTRAAASTTAAQQKSQPTNDTQSKPQGQDGAGKGPKGAAGRGRGNKGGRGNGAAGRKVTFANTTAAGGGGSTQQSAGSGDPGDIDQSSNE